MNSGEYRFRKYVFRCQYFVMRGVIQNKIKIVISSSEVMRLVIIRRRLILHMIKTQLEISTLTEYLLYHLRIQTVELDVNVYNT